METRLNDLVECPFCRESINADARKGKHCHELIGSSAMHNRSAGTASALLRLVLDFVARIAITAKEIARWSNMVLHLHPIAFYYLIGAADGIVLHYKHVYEKDKEAIDALVSNGLVELKVIPGDPDSPFPGAKGLEIAPTEAGKQFLQALGVKPRSESRAEPSTMGISALALQAGAARRGLAPPRG
jgi:hypothetical protein